MIDGRVAEQSYHRIRESINTMTMHNPAQPGEMLMSWLGDLSVSVTGFAAHLGISRVMLSRVLHCYAAISTDMDLRLSEALGTSPGWWLAIQTQRDLWLAKQTAKKRTRVKPWLCLMRRRHQLKLNMPKFNNQPSKLTSRWIKDDDV